MTNHDCPNVIDARPLLSTHPYLFFEDFNVKPGPYGPFPYSPINDRPKLTWPNEAHVALWIIPNIEFFALHETIPAGTGTEGAPSPAPDIPSWSIRDYGNRIGVFRVMEVLDHYGIRGTVALNSDLCAQHPRIIEEGMKRNWEWMGHNESNSRRLNAIDPGQEQQVIRNSLATIERATGKRPKRWLSSAAGRGTLSTCSRRRIRLRLGQ